MRFKYTQTLTHETHAILTQTLKDKPSVKVALMEMDNEGGREKRWEHAESCGGSGGGGGGGGGELLS